MEQKSRPKIILEILCETHYVVNIKWSKDYQVFVNIIEEPTEREKEHVRKLLLLLCDKYKVIFRVQKKKKWWQKFLERLK